MDANFWHERWESNRLGFHQGHVNSHLERHWSAVSGDGKGTVFVPLCGKAHDLAWLRECGHRVIGVEISPIACRDFFRERGVEPKIEDGQRYTRYSHDGIDILCGDFFALAPSDLGPVHFVYDRAALIAIPPDRRQAYADHLRHIAPQAGRFLLITLDYPTQESFQGPPFNVSDREVQERFSDTHHIERLYQQSLPADDGLVKRGLRDATESVFLLSNRQSL